MVLEPEPLLEGGVFEREVQTGEEASEVVFG